MRINLLLAVLNRRRRVDLRHRATRARREIQGRQASVWQRSTHRTRGWIDAGASLRIPYGESASAVCLCRTNPPHGSRPRRDYRRRTVLGRFRQEFAYRPQHPARKLRRRERQRRVGPRPRRQRPDRRISPDHRPATVVSRANDRIQPRGGRDQPDAGLSRKEIIGAACRGG